MEKGDKDKKKRPLFKKWWFWLIVIVFIGVIGSSMGDKEELTKGTALTGETESKTNIEEASPVQEQEEEENEQVYQIGDSFVTGDLGVTIIEVDEKTEFRSDNMFTDNVTTEGKFVVVTAKITNNDTKSRTFSSSMFKIIDEQGREFETLTDFNLMMILGDNDLFLESCNPGMSRTGIFVFEVPENISSYSLKVYSGTAFAAKTSVTVKLK